MFASAPQGRPWSSSQAACRTSARRRRAASGPRRAGRRSPGSGRWAGRRRLALLGVRGAAADRGPADARGPRWRAMMRSALSPARIALKPLPTSPTTSSSATKRSSMNSSLVSTALRPILGIGGSARGRGPSRRTAASCRRSSWRPPTRRRAAQQQHPLGLLALVIQTFLPVIRKPPSTFVANVVMLRGVGAGVGFGHRERDVQVAGRTRGRKRCFRSSVPCRMIGSNRRCRCAPRCSRPCPRRQIGAPAAGRRLAVRARMQAIADHRPQGSRGGRRTALS